MRFFTPFSSYPSSSISQHNSIFFLASFSPPSGHCVLPLSSQPTAVCRSPGRCRRPRTLFDEQRLISKEHVRSAGHAAGSSGCPPEQRAEGSSGTAHLPPAPPASAPHPGGVLGMGAREVPAEQRWLDEVKNEKRDR